MNSEKVNKLRKTNFHIMVVFLIFVSILFGSATSAQVQVKNEPRHHNVFENEFVRILDVYLGPNDTTLYHLHNTPSVFIVFTNANVGSQLAGGQPAKGASLSGEITYDNLTTPRIHRVWNEDTAWFHVMDIELISNSTEETVQPPGAAGLQPVFTGKMANGYKADLNRGKSIHLPESKKGYLLLCTSNAIVNLSSDHLHDYRKMKPGHYKWIGANEKVSVENKDTSMASFVILQLK